MAKECGFNSVQQTLPAQTTHEELAALVKSLNTDETVHGILVQLPLPKHLDSEPIIQSILPEKDVDGLNVFNSGKLATGDLETGLVSCTPAGAMHFGPPHTWRGPLGSQRSAHRPVEPLRQADGAVTASCQRHRYRGAFADKKPAGCLPRRRYSVAAVGRPEMVKADRVKRGATVIDVGINRIDAPERGERKTPLVGDVAFAELSEVSGNITPVPGGVGPMIIAMLMANTVIAAHKTLGRMLKIF